MPTSLLRFLDLVQRELEADDVHIEIGGRDPAGERLAWCALSNGWRLVAAFSADITDRAEVQERIERLAQSFSGITVRPGAEPVALPAETLTHRLDDELEALTLRAGAIGAVVVDDSSPVLWGTSGPRRHGSDVEALLLVASWTLHTRELGLDLLALLELDEGGFDAELARAGVPEAECSRLSSYVERLRERGPRTAAAWRRQLAIAQAVHRLRHAGSGGEAPPPRFMLQEQELGVLSRSFANIYRVVLAFEGPFSEIQADGALLHALPFVERLVLALPPVDPQPSGRVLPLPLPRR